MPAPWPYPFWIAHRGAGREAPENTLAAFRAGLAQGFRMFECDVKLSADDVPFLLHDDTLERTTSGRGPAGALAWSALAQLDAGAWHGPAFTGERLPTLAALASLLQSAGACVNLEIKPMPGTEERTGRLVATAAARGWIGAEVPPLLSSFSAAALRAAAKAAPALPRALLLDALPPDAPAAAAALGCVALVLHHRLADAALIDRLHAAGLRAMAYTVNEPGDVARLRAAGLDGLITDNIGAFGAAAGGGG